jgi:hypothetical protein
MSRGILFILEFNGANIQISIYGLFCGSVPEEPFQCMLKIPRVVCYEPE